MNRVLEVKSKKRKVGNLLFTLTLFTLLLSSCNGIFEGLYDEPLEEEEETTTDKQSNITHFVNFNVNGYDSWIYLDLHTCKVTEVIKIPTTLTGEWDGKSGISYKHGLGEAMTSISELHTDSQSDAEQWDIAIHHFDVKTNGLGAYETNYTSFDQLPEGTDWLADVLFVEDEWTTNHVLYDLGGMLNYDVGYQNTFINRVLTSWVTMDLSTPPPIYNMSDKVRIIRLEENEYVAVKLYNYMNSMGLKGYLTFDVKPLNNE